VTESRTDAIAKADALCAVDPIQAAVRGELLEIESTMSAELSTDSAEAWIYQLIINPTTGKADSLPMSRLTRVVRHFVVEHEGNLPFVLDFISQLLANPDIAGRKIPDYVRASIDDALHEHRNVGDGWEFYGLGVCSGAICLDEKAPGAEEYARAGRIAEHPDAHPLWFTKLVTRDTRTWTVLAEQGGPLTYGTSGPDEVEPEESPHPTSLSLMRLVSAIVGD